MKHTFGKRLGALGLCLCLMLSLLPGTALAAGTDALEVTSAQAQWGPSADQLTQEGSLADALAELETDPGTNYIKLLNDAELETATTLEGGAASSLTLDLNGHKITRNTAKRTKLFRLGYSDSDGTSYANLTVTDTGNGEKGSITSVDDIFYVEMGSTLTLMGGIKLTCGDSVVLQNEHGTVKVGEGGFTMTGSGSYTLYNRGTLEGNNIHIVVDHSKASGGGAALMLESGEVTGLNATAHSTNGSAVKIGHNTYDYDVSVEITGGNYSTDNYFSALLIFNKPKASLTLKGGEFRHNGGSKSIDCGSRDFASLLGENCKYTDIDGNAVTDEETLKVAEYLKVSEADLPHSHAMSAECETGENAVTFTALTSADQLANGGDFYLTGDLTITSDIVIQGGKTVNLCLNGHKLTRSGSGLYALEVGSSNHSTAGTLNICDCSAGKTGGICNEGGSALQINKKGSVDLYGGAVTGTRAGVTNWNHFAMYGGSVTGTGIGGVVSQQDTAETKILGGTVTGKSGVNTWIGGLLTLGGSPTITGGEDGGIKIDKNGKTKITVEPGLTGTYSVKASPALNDGGSCAFTEPSAADHSIYFTPTDPGCEIRTVTADGGLKVVELYKPAAPPHTHIIDGREVSFQPLPLPTYDRIAVTDGGYYYLPEDVSGYVSVGYLPDDAVATLCLNGHSITSDYEALEIVGDTALVDCSADKTGTLTGAEDYPDVVLIAMSPKSATVDGVRYPSLDVTGYDKGLSIELDGEWPDDMVVLTGTEDTGKYTLHQHAGRLLRPKNGSLVTGSYAITQQPNAGNDYTVVADPAGATYQWYTAQEAKLTVGAFSGDPVPEGYIHAEPFSGNYGGGVWTAEPSGDSIYSTILFIALNDGDVVHITPSKSLSKGCLVTDMDETYETQLQADPDGSYTYIAHTPPDPRNTVLLVESNEEFTCTVTVERVILGDAAVSTGAKLTTTAPGTYVCKVVWEDGTVVISDPVTIELPPHVHDMSVECGDDAAVTFDHVLTAADGKLCVDGTSIEPVEEYGDLVTTLPAGNYYLTGDVTFDGYVEVIDENEAPVNLCLNGHALDLGEGRIDICNTSDGVGVLNLCDCGKDGMITSTFYSASKSHGTISVSNQFAMYGGKIVNTGNNERNHEIALGINGGTARLYGGEIVSQRDNAIHMDLNEGTALALSGSVKLSGATDAAEIDMDNGYDAKRITVEGPLTVQAAPYRVTAKMPNDPLTSGWSTHMADADFSHYFVSATKGLFIEKNAAGELTLSPYAIEGQPTDNVPTVTVNNDTGATYQWCAVSTQTVTAENATPVTREGSETSTSSFADGKWTGAASYGVSEYFDVEMKAGETLTVTLHGTFSGRQLMIQTEDRSGWANARVSQGTTVYSLTAPSDGTYTLIYGGDGNMPQVSAELTRLTPVTGQNTDTLTATAEGDYVCQITWPDGTVLASDPVTVAAAPSHTHTWGDWTITAAPTETETGAAERVCAKNEAHKDAVTLPVLTDTTVWTKGARVEPTNLAPGKQEYTSQYGTVTVELPIPAYGISGEVNEPDGESKKPVPGATVLLMRGTTEVARTVTDENGYYSFENVPIGSYNVVAKQNPETESEKTMTILVTLTEGDAGGQDLTMPTDNVNSVLEITDNSGATDTAAKVDRIVVGGLEKEAEANKPDSAEAASTTVTVTMTVESKAEAQVEKAPEIKAQAGAGTTLEYLEIKVEKKVETAGSEPVTTAIPTTQDLLTIIIPFDFAGKDKDSVKVYRFHGDKVDVLDAKENVDKEYMELGADSIVLHVKNFSAYAVGYTEAKEEPTPTRPSRPSYTVRVPEKKTCPKDKTCPIHPFTDADAHAWYHDGVHFCLEKGLMVGTSETTFAPEMDTSRAMIAAILWRLQGSPVVNYAMRYDDVPEDTWYTEAVRWATSEGIVKGYDTGAFGPDDPITREQLAVMLYRYEQKYGGGFTGNWMFLLDFADAAQVSDWADEAMHWMTMKKVIAGKDNKVLDPAGTATRAEAATMLQRYIQLDK